MTRPPLDVQAASRLAPSVRLRDITCVQIEAKFVGAPESESKGTLAWDMPDPTALWELEGTELRVLFPLQISVSTENGKRASSKRLAEFRLSLRLEYELKPGESWSESDIPHFVGITGLMHAWPYLRAEIQWLTTKVGLPPLVLPVIVSGHAAGRVSVRPFRPKAARAKPKRGRSKSAR